MLLPLTLSDLSNSAPRSGAVCFAARQPRWGVTFPPIYRSGLRLRRERGSVYGERTMANLVMDVVLFSSTLAFVTAVVIAAAKLLI